MFYDFRFEVKYLNLYQHLGIHVASILKQAGVPPRAIHNEHYKLTLEQYKAVLESFDRQIDVERIVEFSKIESNVMFVPEFFAGLCAGNGHQCIERISKYKKIIAPINMVVESNLETTTITYQYQDKDKLPFSMLMNAFLSILSIVRQGSGNPDIKPIALYTKTKYPQSAIDYMGIEPTISETNKIVFNHHDLNQPFVTENNYMWEYLETELNQRLKETYDQQSFSALVRQTLIELIPGGISDQERIAFELGMSKRTLQRKLSEEGTTFNQQLNQTRELLVRNYLKTGMNLDEIAFLVNYLDVKSLSRAFKSWTGMSVTAYRKQVI